MFKASVKIPQREQLMRKLPNFHNWVGEKFMYACGFFVQERAKKKVPVDTSRLKTSIKLTVDNEGIKSTALITAGNETELNYAPHVEYGTKPHKVSGKHLLNWVHRHGMPSSAAFAIANTIAKKGVKARPFMRPAKEALREEQEKLLQKVYLQAKKQFPEVS